MNKRKRTRWQNLEEHLIQQIIQGMKSLIQRLTEPEATGKRRQGEFKSRGHEDQEREDGVGGLVLEKFVGKEADPGIEQEMGN